MLVRRAFATLDIPIDEQCDLEEHSQETYVQEEEWYAAELKRAQKSKK
jgi:hypothetical protein